MKHNEKMQLCMLKICFLEKKDLSLRQKINIL